MARRRAPRSACSSALAEAARRDQPRLESLIARKLAFVHAGMRKFDVAVPLLQRSLAIEQKLEPSGVSPGIVGAWLALGRMQGYAGNARAWVAAMRRAIPI